MKKNTCIILAIVFAGLAVCVGFFLFPRQLPTGKCGELYRHYKDSEGIEASFVKDFRVNDSVTVNATLFQAKDSVTWVNLVVDLYHIESREEYVPCKISFKLVSKEVPNNEMQKGITNNDFMIAFFPDLTIGIFDIKTEQQYYALIDKYFILLNKNQTK